MNTFYHLHNQHHHHQEPIIIVTATRTPCSWSLFSPRFIIYSLDLLELINVALKVPCKRTQHCWPTTPKIDGCYMLRPFAHLVACCWMLLRSVWTGQIFQPTTPNISFVPWSPKRSATMLDPFAQLFQHCWDHALSLRMVYKDLWVVSAGPNIVGSCCIRLHTTANTHATTPNIVGATMLGVVASVCTQPKN